MRLFMVVPMTPSTAASDPVGQRDCCLLIAASLFLPRGFAILQEEQTLSSQQFIASEKFTVGVVDTGEQFIVSVVDTSDKIVPCCH
jgi:hypothetical protein